MASFSTLTEDWSSGIDAGKWNNWGGSPYVAVSGGKLVVTNNPGTTNYYGIVTQVTYDLTGTFVAVETSAVSSPVTTTDTTLGMTVLNLEIATANRYFMEVGTNGTTTVLRCYKVIADSYNEFYNEAWNATNHKYLRIRESSGTAYYERSSNGYSWTTMGSIATTSVAVTALYLGISTGHWAPVPNTYSFSVDNINLMPSAPSTQGLLMMF